MSYINVQIYDDAAERLRQTLKDAELKFWREESERLKLQIENIPAAVERWGHVTISSRRYEVTLIAKPDPEDLATSAGGEEGQ